MKFKKKTKFKNNKCPFCGLPVRIDIHQYEERKPRYYICHDVIVKNVLGSAEGCCFFHTSTYEKITDLLKIWNKAFK